MGAVLSIVPVILALAAMFGHGPEQENPTLSGIQGQQNGVVDFRFNYPNLNHEKLDRLGRYLQTNMTHNELSPTVWPTEEEFSDAKERFEYSPANLHLAVTGIAGSGKSSLVNAFRGLRAVDPGAAKTGVIETTKEAGRYPHPEMESPLARIVWYDFPGAGTLTTPGSSAYFNAQGLFIFDLIIVAIGDRITEQDLSILANCKMYNIPSFVIRSKADIHIQSLENDYGYIYEDARERYIYDTRNSFKEEAGKAAKEIGLSIDKEIFLISNTVLRAFVRSFMDGKLPEHTKAMIDEERLLANVLLAAQMRRYPSKHGIGWELLKFVDLEHDR